MIGNDSLGILSQLRNLYSSVYSPLLSAWVTCVHLNAWLLSKGGSKLWVRMLVWGTYYLQMDLP